ncbi:MAG: VacJ family lipoprotein [Arenicellales bacterium]
MPRLLTPTRSLVMVLLATFLCGCAHTGAVGESRTGDPWEHFNRSMFKFNDNVDRAVLKPVARGYKAVLPGVVRKHVGYFFLNLQEPTTIVNDVLQGKLRQAGLDFSRFAFNSTFGVLGVFDVATPLGMERHEEDFGQTFSVWGFSTGPYLVLPFLGPSTVADGIGLVPSTLYTDLRTAYVSADQSYALVGASAIDTRARLLGASKVLQLQLDPYVAARETYLQRRRLLVYDGKPPQDDDEPTD